MLVVAEPEQLPVPQARAGDPVAWDLLFRRYQLPLYVYLFELARDEQASLDIVQETFIAATRHLGSLREDGKFGSWLFGIAHQKVVQRWRKQGRETAALEELAAVPADAEDGPAELLIQDFPLEDIAAVTGAALGTVKSRLHYGKKALRKLIEEEAL